MSSEPLTKDDVIGVATECFGSWSSAKYWLYRPHAAFDGLCPYSVLARKKYQEVYDYLTKFRTKKYDNHS